MISQDVLLVAPICSDNIERANFTAPHLGIHRMAEYVRRQGFTVVIYDVAVATEPLSAILARYNFRVIGFSLVHDSVSSESKVLEGSFSAIHLARSYQPQAFILSGGPEAVEGFETIFSHTPVDGICLGEGEDALLSLLRGEDPGKIDGLMLRRYAAPMTAKRLWEYFDAIDWKTLDYPTYWKKTAALYDNPDEAMINVVRLVHLTHCARGCQFCSVSGVNRFNCGRVTRPVALKAWQILCLMTRIKMQIEGVRGVYFCGDDFFYDAASSIHFLKSYVNSDINLDLLIQTYTGRLTEDLVGLLADARCRHITCGVENASSRIRRIMGKSQDEEKIESIVDWCVARNIVPYYLLILFHPEITKQELWENVRAVRRWTEKGAQVSIEPYLMPYRSAPIYNMDYEFEYQTLKVDGSGGQVRQPVTIWPRDEEVRKVMKRFRTEWPGYLSARMAEKKHRHTFKGTTGIMMVDFLERLLKGQTA